MSLRPGVKISLKRTHMKGCNVVYWCGTRFRSKLQLMRVEKVEKKDFVRSDD